MSYNGFLSFKIIFEFILDDSASCALKHHASGIRFPHLDTFASDSPCHVFAISVDADLIVIVFPWSGIHLRGYLLPAIGRVRRLLQMSVGESFLGRTESSNRRLPILERMHPTGGCANFIGRGILARPRDFVSREQQVFPQRLESSSGHLPDLLVPSLHVFFRVVSSGSRRYDSSGVALYISEPETTTLSIRLRHGSS